MADPSSTDAFILAIDPATPPKGLAGAVVAIGNFDGVHRGHRTVVARAEALAHRLGRPCAVLTFEPHPSDFFRGPNTIFRLTPPAAKAKAFRRLGLDGMIVISFDAALARLSAEDFVAEILVRRLAVGAVVAGYDFHFGAGRAGTPAFLKEAGAKHGFEVEIVERVPAAPGAPDEAASSTATRAALEAGDVEGAARRLGRPYSIIGAVVEGQKLGRTIGFPTANLRPDPSCRLRHGVYAVRVEADGELHDGVANYGRRPTVDDGPPLLEAFLFDFSGDLYGRTIEVFFFGWIRGETKFASVEALAAQIKQDLLKAREILAVSPSGAPGA
ncbi:bifunctional riboflavin kinase/FAD synthetase [Methylocapsa acidiphila]|uniref:bifunctional riboflavin kinase/FAD synthetase n=1 Tax=Methylocapsa acidiphila TaxID=133552 RepID=UPI000419DC1C|nr:bifunctional riboflavin kinase/FAD synthetase [Methylocapsa acidiphila]